MPIPKKPIHLAAVTLAVLFSGLCVAGICGAWFVERKAAGAALKAFGLIEVSIGVVEAGVGRVEDLVTKGRTEVRQAAETITTVGAQAQANRPVLTALNERLEVSLAPRIPQIRQVLAPVRDAVATVGHAVSLVNSLPMMADRAPRLAALDEALGRLEELSADTSQLGGTLRTLAAQNGDVAAATVATLQGLAQRIDTRLGEVQANVQEAQAEVAALQVRLEERKARVLCGLKIMAVVSTLMLAWLLYTQVVVLRHHWTHVCRQGG